MAIFKTGQLRPVLQTVPEEPELAQQQAPPRPRMEPRPAAVKYENRHSLIPVVKELDASLPPSWRPPSPPSQSFFDWSDDEIEPTPKPRRRRKSSKGKEPVEETAAAARESQDTRKLCHTFPDQPGLKHNVDDSPGTLVSKRSSAESKKTSSDHRSSSETTGTAKDSLIRAVKSLKNLRTASRSTSSLPSSTTGTVNVSASDLTMATAIPYDDPPIPPLPSHYSAATSPPNTSYAKSRTTSTNSEVSESSNISHERISDPRNRSSSAQRSSSETLPRMLPMMGSFLGSPTVFIASPSSKHRQDSTLMTSPTSANFKSPGTPSSLPRSVSSPTGAFAPFALGRKLRRHFSSQTEDSDASEATNSTVSVVHSAQSPQGGLSQGRTTNVPATKRNQQRVRMRVNEALFSDEIIVNSARELTAVLLERGRALGLTPVCQLSAFNDNEVDYIAKNYREEKKACVQNYLFKPASISDKPQDHAASASFQSDQPLGLGIAASSSSLCPADNVDAASIFSTISASKIDKALGPDYNPHLSTFGLDAVHYLDGLRKKKAMDSVESDEGSTPTLRASELNVKAERSDVNPTKIKMTPELQQQLFTASLTRAEQLKRMPEHPYLRDEPVSKMSFDSDDGAQEADTASKRVVSPVETQIEELLTTLELEKQKSDGSATLQPDGNRLSETQQVRQDFGLSLLRRPRAGTQKHPKHIFDWHTEKLMCRSIHNPLEILPELPAFDPTREVSMSEFDQHFFENINSAEYKAPIKCASPVCDQYCCHYGKLYVSSLTYQGDISSYSRAMKCMEDANKIKARKPNGVEEWESFLKCTFCLKMYCPSCIKLCAQSICQQPFCIFCSNGKADCEDHEGVL